MTDKSDPSGVPSAPPNPCSTRVWTGSGENSDTTLCHTVPKRPSKKRLSTVGSGSQPEGQIATDGLATLSPAATGFFSMFWTGLMAGLLTFGGAYTAIPYVRADTVGRGLITDGQFLDGIAFAGVIPAPLVIFITFVGFVVGGWTGAFAMTAGMFLPAFAFSMVFYDRLEAAVADARLHNILAGVAAAVVGIIAITSVQIGWATLERVPSIPIAFVIFLVALLTVWFWKSRYATVAILFAAGIAGWFLLGA